MTPGNQDFRANALGKIPAITFSFWVMKICATTLGETGGDLLTKTMGSGYLVGTLIFFAIFLVALGFQLRSRTYHPFLYWGVILSTSTAGTAMSDFMDRTLGLGYATGTAILVGFLFAILAYWRLTEGSLSVTNIRTLRVELLYWITILFSNTLGTALGDFLADDSGLGFAGGALLIGGLIAITALLAFVTRISRVALFWIAFVLTRPFGATMGDVLTREPSEGGLGIGTIGSSAVLTVVLVAVIFYTMRRSTRSASAAAVAHAVNPDTNATESRAESPPAS